MKGKCSCHPELPDDVEKFENCVIEGMETGPRDEDIIGRETCELIFTKKKPVGNPTCYYCMYIPVPGGYKRICIPYPC